VCDAVQYSCSRVVQFLGQRGVIECTILWLLLSQCAVSSSALTDCLFGSL
jgi:hypothetical protein